MIQLILILLHRLCNLCPRLIRGFFEFQIIIGAQAMFIITNLSTFYSELKMNSANGSSNDAQVMEASHFQKLQPVDFSLTYEQYLIIQHYLPKRFALIDHKNIKRGMVVASNVKLGPEDVRFLVDRLKTCREFQGILRTHRRLPAEPRESKSKKSTNFQKEKIPKPEK